ncbi:MAG TPA: hypothetical protein PKK94_26675, partial [Leptospiraceae bacterium]|nr:hypothetical protein [Leptospiraceae bacterium]
DLGLPYVFGTWTTNAGHIVCAVGYNDQGAFICDPYGNWKLGYPAQNRNAGPHLYSWADIDFLMGIHAHGRALPPGYCRTWSAWAEVK